MNYAKDLDCNKKTPRRSVSAGSLKGQRVFSVAESSIKSVRIEEGGYADQDHQRDQDILDRFDREFGLCEMEAAEYHERRSKEKRRLANRHNVDHRSASNFHLSEISSNDFNVSAQANMSSTRRRMKNTIQSLTFERYLAAIDKQFPPMTERDRILNWNCFAEANDNAKHESKSRENVKTPVESKKKIPVANNGSVYENGPDVNRKQATPKYTKSKDRLPLSSERVSISSKHSKDKSNPLDLYTRYGPQRRVYGNAKQIKRHRLNVDTSELKEGATTPKTDSNVVKSTPNSLEMTTPQKEEFYKYLGLETASPNRPKERKTDKLNNKRRSLRVRQLEIQKETKRRAKQDRKAKILPLKDETENAAERLDNLVRVWPNDAEPVDDKIVENPALNGVQSPPPISPKQQKSFGSCKSYGNPASITSKKFETIERIDYPKSKSLKNNSNVSSCNLQNEQSISICDDVNDDCTQTIELVNYDTCMRRKNGFIFNRLSENSADKFHKSVGSFSTLMNNNIVDLTTFDRDPENENIIDVGKRFQEKYRTENIPPVISCMKAVTYEKSNLDKNKQTWQEVKNSSAKSINDLTVSPQAITISNTTLTDDRMSVQSDFNGFEMDSADDLFLLMSPLKAVSSNKKENESVAPSLSSKPTTIVEKSKSVKHNITVPTKNRSFKNSVSLESTKSATNEPSGIEQDADELSKMRGESCERNSTEPMNVEQSPPLNIEQSPTKSTTISTEKPRKPVLRRRKTIKILRRPKIIVHLKAKKKRSLKTITTSMTCNDILTVNVGNVNGETVSVPVCCDNLNAATIEVTENTQPVEELANESFLPNPLSESDGIVLHGYYVQDFLIIVQTKKISFWRYTKILKMLGVAQEWELLGEHERLCTDLEISSPYKNRLCMNELNPVYIEMRAKQFPDDTYRECHMAAVYVNVYYYDEWKASVVVHCVHLDTVRSIYTDIIYTTITNSRYFIMCWNEEGLNNVVRTGICKYALSPNLNMLASIREFRAMRHKLCKIQCLGDDRLIGLGETHVTIWEQTSGNVLVDFDFETVVGHTLESFYFTEGFQEYLFLYQLEQTIIADQPSPKLVILAVRLTDRPIKFESVFQHQLPSNFSKIQSSFSINNNIMVTSADSSQLLLRIDEPQRLLFSSRLQKYCANQFYTTGSECYVQVSDKYLIVNRISELLLDYVRR